MNLASPFGVVLGAASGTITIIDDDAPTSATPVMSVADLRVVEGDSGTALIDAHGAA